MLLSNKNIVITGANRGIGRAVAEMAAKSGARLHLVIRKQDEGLVSHLLSLGAKNVKVWTCDFLSKNDINSLIESMGKTEIDILFNNAGILTGGLIEDQSLDDIYSVFQVNTVGLIQFTRGLLPQMIKRGSGKIINNASVVAFMHFPCSSTYSASKAAVVAFSNSLAAELKGTGVSVLCLVTPGINTEMFRDIKVKYGKHLMVPNDSISPEKFAARVREAIVKDQQYLWPSGFTRFGLIVARYCPRVFNGFVSKFFKR